MTTTAATPQEADSRKDPFEGFELRLTDRHDDQPDPVTLSRPSHDGDGLLRWASVTFDLPH